MTDRGASRDPYPAPDRRAYREYDDDAGSTIGTTRPRAGGGSRPVPSSWSSRSSGRSPSWRTSSRSVRRPRSRSSRRRRSCSRSSSRHSRCTACGRSGAPVANAATAAACSWSPSWGVSLRSRRRVPRHGRSSCSSWRRPRPDTGPSARLGPRWPPSSRGLGRHPFKVEIRGSNPLGGTPAVLRRTTGPVVPGRSPPVRGRVRPPAGSRSRPALPDGEPTRPRGPQADQAREPGRRSPILARPVPCRSRETRHAVARPREPQSELELAHGTGCQAGPPPSSVTCRSPVPSASITVRPPGKVSLPNPTNARLVPSGDQVRLGAPPMQ